MTAPEARAPDAPATAAFILGALVGVALGVALGHRHLPRSARAPRPGSDPSAPPGGPAAPGGA